jgi:hypothetical protein
LSGTTSALASMPNWAKNSTLRPGSWIACSRLMVWGGLAFSSLARRGCRSASSAAHAAVTARSALSVPSSFTAHSTATESPRPSAPLGLSAQKTLSLSTLR